MSTIIYIRQFHLKKILIHERVSSNEDFVYQNIIIQHLHIHSVRISFTPLLQLVCDIIFFNDLANKFMLNYLQLPMRKIIQRNQIKKKT